MKAGSRWHFALAVSGVLALACVPGWIALASQAPTAAPLALPGLVPTGLATGPEGELYVASAPNEERPGQSCVWMIRDGHAARFAGTGESGFAGDGSQAREARLSGPEDVALDAEGNLFIADRGNYRVRKVDRGGTITTVAGCGEQGWAGDGGPAVAAKLVAPMGVVCGMGGDLFIAERVSRVRRVDTHGIITTVAGSDDLQQSSTGDGGPAAKATLAWPTALASSRQGDLYIVDMGSGCTRRIDARGVITTIAGGGVGAWSAPHVRATGIAVEASGALLVSDGDRHRVYRVAPGRAATVVAGSGAPGYTGDGGQAADARLSWPGRLAVGRDGAIYIADADAGAVRKVDSKGVITTVAVNGDR